ncbi:MAG TPA: hypothetical protein VHF51_15580 [Solirubrobacteraceae bacterium]|nr:hypothetical protein [Solirubrobacteraceae bacterium]
MTPGPPPPERARRLLIGVVAGGVLVLIAAGWFALRAGEAPPARHAHGPDRGPEQVVTRRVGRPLVERTARGRTVRLGVTAEVPPKARRSPAAVPAGAPLRLVFTIAGRPVGTPRVSARRLPANGGQSATAGPRVPLERSELFLLNRRTGNLVIPSGEAGSTDHSHGGQPGAGLAQLSPGGGYAWATKVPPGAAWARADERGRYVLVGYPRAGRVEVVDMLRHARAGTIDTGRAAAAMEAAGDRLWVADAAGDRLSAIDLAARRTIARVRVPGRAQAIVFAGRDRALVTSAADGGTATLVDARRHRVVGTVSLDAPPAAAAFVRKAHAFVIAHADGRLTTLPLAGGELGRPRSIRVGPATGGTGTVRVAPDGRTAVALNARAGTIAVVDVVRRRLVQTAEAGAGPAEVAFLDHFALVRNARSPEVTWVDLDVPSRSNNIRVGSVPGRGLFADVTGDEVLVPSAADRQLYRLHAMHGRPMVMGQIPNPARADAGVTSKGGLERTGGGRYELRTLIADPGRYRLTVRLPGSERVRFDLAVESADATVRARSARNRLRARPGEPLTVRFDVTGARPASAQVLAYSSGAIRQARAAARHIGGTSYEATLRLPDPGSYRLTLIAERGLPTKSEDLGAIVTVAAGQGG